jgi:hypothetical protein
MYIHTVHTVCNCFNVCKFMNMYCTMVHGTYIHTYHTLCIFKKEVTIKYERCVFICITVCMHRGGMYIRYTLMFVCMYFIRKCRILTIAKLHYVGIIGPNNDSNNKKHWNPLHNFNTFGTRSF